MKSQVLIPFEAIGGGANEHWFCCGLVLTFNPSEEKAFCSKVTCESPVLYSQFDRC